MFIDLEADFPVVLPCQCRVTFHGGGRNHKLIGFSCAHPLEAMKAAKTANQRLAVHDAHKNACIRAAKRWRASQMEKIGPDEPGDEPDPTPEPEPV